MLFTLNSFHFMSNIFLLNKTSLNLLNSVEAPTPFAVLYSLLSIFFIEHIFDLGPTNSVTITPTNSSLILPITFL